MTSYRKSKTAIWLLASTVLCVSLVLASSTGYSFSSQYDPYFQRHAGRWMPDHDWRWLKAQCYQESLLNPEAISEAGAEGLCQFMLPSWGEYQAKFSTTAKRTVAKESIRAAGWYMHRMERIWAGRGRYPEMRLPLAQASFNCGAGCVIQAQARCNDALEFWQIAPCLNTETREYPCKIRKHYFRLTTE